MDKEKRQLLLYNNAIAKKEYLENKIKYYERDNEYGLKIGKYVDGLHRVIERKKVDRNVKKRMKEIIQLKGYGLNQEEHRERKIIVSLTSYEPRLKYVIYSIASLLTQKTKPDRVILWMSCALEHDNRLDEIKKLAKYGLEIRYCEDIKSHKKWFYSFQEFPDELIITADDDVIYNDSFIEKLYNTYKVNSNYVPALRVHKMRFSDELTVLPYHKWVYEYQSSERTASYSFFLTGCGGALFQPRRFDKEVYNLQNILSICPRADDIWLDLMCVISGLRPIKADSLSDSFGIVIWEADRYGLWQYNNKEGGFEVQMNSFLKKYNNYLEGETLCERIALDGVHFVKP